MQLHVVYYVAVTLAELCVLPVCPFVCPSVPCGLVTKG